ARPLADHHLHERPRRCDVLSLTREHVRFGSSAIKDVGGLDAKRLLTGSPVGSPLFTSKAPSTCRLIGLAICSSWQCTRRPRTATRGRVTPSGRRAFLIGVREASEPRSTGRTTRNDPIPSRQGTPELLDSAPDRGWRHAATRTHAHAHGHA